MKLDVPFSIPEIFDILFAANSSFNNFIIGVPAQTADSKRTLTLFSSANLKISSP
jgi:hypothetical protein